MSAKWYRAYQVYGHRDVYINRISALVRQNDLSNIIPCLHTERLKRGQTIGEFYLFIGFSSDVEGEIPWDIEQLFGTVTLGHFAGNFRFEQIKSMVSSEIDTTNYVRRIAYHPPPVLSTEDPLDLSELETLTEKQGTEELVLALNHLLYWISATGSGTWQTFKKAYEKLAAEKVDLEARQIFRHFRLLGHVEYTTSDGSKWSVCPPVLVQIGNTDTYFLAGQRTPYLIKILNDLTSLEEMFQSTKEAPSFIQIKLDSTEAAQALTRDDKIRAICPLRWGGPASDRLATILPDLKDYRSSLSLISGFVVSNFISHRWDGQKFVECHFEGKTGMYQLVPRDPKSPLSKRVWFFDAEQNCWRSGPRYDLRYLAQQEAGEPCRVIYHHNLRHLSIPAYYRWPDLYERALVLASGLLPIPSHDRKWFYFGEVPLNVARILSQKLNATLEEI